MARNIVLESFESWKNEFLWILVFSSFSLSLLLDSFSYERNKMLLSLVVELLKKLRVEIRNRKSFITIISGFLPVQVLKLFVLMILLLRITRSLFLVENFVRLRRLGVGLFWVILIEVVFKEPVTGGT